MIYSITGCAASKAGGQCPARLAAVLSMPPSPGAQTGSEAVPTVCMSHNISNPASCPPVTARRCQPQANPPLLVLLLSKNPYRLQKRSKQGNDDAMKKSTKSTKRGREGVQQSSRRGQVFRTGGREGWQGRGGRGEGVGGCSKGGVGCLPAHPHPPRHGNNKISWFSGSPRHIGPVGWVQNESLREEQPTTCMS